MNNDMPPEDDPKPSSDPTDYFRNIKGSLGPAANLVGYTPAVEAWNEHIVTPLNAFGNVVSVAAAQITLFATVLEEAEKNTAAPFDLLFLSMLSAAAISAQGVADVLMPYGELSPLSLIIFGTGAPGSGKSPAILYFHSSISDFTKKKYEEFREDFENYDRAIVGWSDEKAGISKAIVGARSKGMDVSQLRKEQDDHLRSRPVEPMHPRILIADISQEKLVTLLAESPTVGLVSAEAERVFSGHVTRVLALFNEAWDGVVLDRLRVSSESVRAEAPRLTLTLFGQPEVFEDFVSNKGKKGRYLGFLARALIVRSGTQVDETRYHDGPKVFVATNAFRARVNELLCEAWEVSAGLRKRVVLKLTPEAEVRWKQIRGQIQREMVDGGRFSNAKDYASKLTINTVRVAAIIHLIEKFDGDISVSTLNVAFGICNASAEEFLDIFAAKYTRKQLVDALDSDLQEFRTRGIRFIAVSYFGAYGTSCIRDLQPFGSAVKGLIDLRKISLVKQGRGWYIDTLPGEPATMYDQFWKLKDGNPKYR